MTWTATSRTGASPPRRAANVRVVLHRALAHAERWGLVQRNVASLVDTPRGGGAKTDDALDVAGVKQLPAAAEGDRLEALWVTAVVVGLRKGEALALTWGDIDLDAAELTVRGSLRRVPGHGLVLNAPKSERGARVVALPPLCVDVLRRRKQTQRLERVAAGPRWTDSGYVFTTEIGTPIDPDNLHRAWRKMTTKAGLEPLRFHTLRHSAATVALAQGVPLEVISRQLGHAGYAITADVYAHIGEAASETPLMRCKPRLDLPSANARSLVSQSRTRQQQCGQRRNEAGLKDLAGRW